MPTEQKQLGQLRPANTTAASLYSPPAKGRAWIRMIVICILTSSATTFRIFHDDDGTTYDQTTAMFYDVSIAANTTVEFSPDNGFISMVNSLGNIGVRTGTSSALTFTAYGEEITQ